MGFEKRALQVAVAVGSLVPIGGGLAGVIFGPALLGGTGRIDFDSHFSYLSGLLFAIGVGFLSTVPNIERHQDRFGILTSLIVVGGLGRLASMIVLGLPSGSMTAALMMELLVTPALALWQTRVARGAERA